MTVVVAYESESIRAVIRHLLEGAGWAVHTVSDGHAAIAALGNAPAALVIDVAVGGVHAYAVVEEVRRRGLSTRVVLVASIYNRTSYKRKPTSLYGADDYVEQHHIPDSLVEKLARLIGPPPSGSISPPPHQETPEGQVIRDAAQHRLEDPSWLQVQRAERLARLIVADIALYNAEALDAEDIHELDARLRSDLEEGRLLFDLRVPLEVRRKRDFIGEALAALVEERQRARGEGVS
jgi:CheY-like chemotaxis protein